MGDRDGPRPWPVVRDEDKGDFEIFRARALHVRSPRDGSEHTFHVADAPDGVTVLPFTPEGELVMVRQWRHPVQCVTLELPAGMIEEGEPPERAGARELREETGYAGGDPECIGALIVNPSWATTRLHAVVIRGVRREGEKELDEGEETRVVCVPLDQARRMIVSGEIDSATTVAALALYLWRMDGGGGAGDEGA